jgi:hypothetical protein
MTKNPLSNKLKEIYHKFKYNTNSNKILVFFTNIRQT